MEGRSVYSCSEDHQHKISSFNRQLVNFLFHALCQLSRTTLQPLQKFQNNVMQFFLGCSASTRIVDKLSEVNLTPFVDSIYKSVTYCSIKCLHFPHLAPHYTHVIRAILNLNTCKLQLRPGERRFVGMVCVHIRTLAIDVPVVYHPGEYLFHTPVHSCV